MPRRTAVATADIDLQGTQPYAVPGRCEVETMRGKRILELGTSRADTDYRSIALFLPILSFTTALGLTDPGSNLLKELFKERRLLVSSLPSSPGRIGREPTTSNM